MKREFHELITEHIADWMHDNEGREVYAEDLASEITMDANYTGAWIIGTYRASEFIREYWDEAAATFEYFHTEMMIDPNPFQEPEAFTFYMLDWGVHEVLGDLDIMNRIWGDRIEIGGCATGEIMEAIAA